MEKVRVDELKINRKLRINIDSDWSVSDFIILFKSIDSLYSFYLGYIYGIHLLNEQKKSQTTYAHERHRPLFHFVTSRSLIRSFSEKKDEGIYLHEERHERFIVFNREIDPTTLMVGAVKYSSPGFTDFTGIAGALGHLKDIIMHYLPNKMSKEEIKIKEQERIKLQIQNLKDMGFSSIEIKKIMLLEEITLDKIKLLIEEGKITAMEITEN